MLSKMPPIRRRQPKQQRVARVSKMENKLLVASMEQARSLALPPVTSNFIVSQTQRFMSTGAFSVTITAADLFGLLCTVIGVTPTASAISCYSAVKLRKIEMWAAPANTNIPVSVGCEFVTRSEVFGSNGLLRINSSVGSQAGHLVRRPPRNALGGMWISENTTDTILELYGPTNSIVDVSYSAATQDDTQTPFVVTSGATTPPVAGRMLVAPFDGYTSGFTGGILQPVLYQG